ncbi:SRPBCC domain-containing protein [Hydrogenophaga sp.]|uniref:SRPBCC family protein n=1 Tax=Hydrogenophaga sp. TaxID=1904254 RepID=UPI00262DEA2D|nr:SRPBCC domain-containing protein [Hydrogenophaga sp.]MCW5652933.1 SRPBCC domain-containing protein [Hydrogenophaga sp.]
MQTQHFEIHIQAPRERVWAVMLQSPTYERWTRVFCEGSRYEGSWQQGEKIRFLGPDGQGMVSEIAEHRPAEFVSIRHLGLIEKGREDTTSEAVRAWAPCYENYTFTDEAGGTRLKVAADVFGGYEEMMASTWPRALDALKSLCESAA